MKVRRGPPVERIINDPPPKPLIRVKNTTKGCSDPEDAACRIRELLRPVDARRQTQHGTMLTSEDINKNTAAQLIEAFPMVLFRSKKGSDGLKCSRILKEARQAVNLKKEVIIEVIITESKVSMEILTDLEEITGADLLPQVFICEKFIGGLVDLRRLREQGLVEIQLRRYAKDIGNPHPSVRFTSDGEKKKQSFLYPKFLRIKKEYDEIDKAKRKH